MENFYIKSGKKNLQCVFYPASIKMPIKSGIILNNPLGQKQIRCQRIYKILAERLSGCGFNVLRYDYTSTADSSGDEKDLNIQSCIEDLDIVLKEIKSGCNLEEVSLFGLEFGASLAAIYAQTAEISKIILWDPIIYGNSFIKAIKMEHTKWLQGSFACPSGPKAKNIECLGYTLSDKLYKELIKLNIQKLKLNYKQILIIGHDSRSTKRLIRSYTKKNNETHFQKLHNDHFWRKEENNSGAVIPTEEINFIENWLVQEEYNITV